MLSDERTNGWTVAELALLYVAPESNPSRFPTVPVKPLSLFLSPALFLSTKPRGAHYCPLGDARAATRDLSPRVFYWLLPATVASRHTVPRTIDVLTSRFRAPGLSARDIVQRTCSR